MIADDSHDKQKTLFNVSARVAQILNLIDIVLRALGTLLTLWSVRIGLQILSESHCPQTIVVSDSGIGEVQERSNRYDVDQVKNRRR